MFTTKNRMARQKKISTNWRNKRRGEIIKEIKKRFQVRGSHEIFQNTQKRENAETMRIEEMKWGGIWTKITGIQSEVGQNKASKSDMTA